MRIFCYARVSTESQTTENQKMELSKFLKDNFNAEINEKRYFAENISGKVPASERPVFQKLLNKLDEGDMLVVTKIDRLGRSTKDILNTIEYISKEIKAKLFIIQLGFIDFSSSAGKLVLTIMSAIAEMERDLIVERVKSGMARAKKEGRVAGKPSLERNLHKKGFSINDVMSDLSNGISVKNISKKFGICEMSIYKLKWRENKKYEDYVRKYFEVEMFEVPGGSCIKEVRFKNEDAKNQWFNNETENNKKVILNSISNKELKNRILILLGSDNFDLVKTK